ncbi:hypothetical protein NET02_12360 [Thermomicrobiaceae bacterium CFH 74404]|uniref:DUF4878 domain-containing protein n=1 Tax=Thermalbibacter longus TaxID=2951981 RepID=A0AA42BDP5_9BACT|nr:hypothetical protein [Thermalbibacter longus]MCM8749943.1 hypothetical protein [Thermalbibacter longus]
MSPNPRRSLAVVPLLLLVFACSRGPAPTPTPTLTPSDQVKIAVRSYLAAIYAGEAEKAWDMHTRETNQGESFDQFAEAVDVAASVGDQIEIVQIDEPEINGEEARCTVVQRLGPRISVYTFTLRYEDGEWRIHNPAQFNP